jgi:hypothetical protein
MAQTQMQTQVRTEVLGRITKAPKLSRTTEGGVAVCRFTVATEVGPASNPVVKDVFVVGDPSVKVSEDLPVFVPGIEHQRMQKLRGVRFPVSAVKADDVKLRARA